MRPKESTMSKESTREYKPPVRIAPPFEAAVEAFLKVDLKKLHGREAHDEGGEEAGCSCFSSNVNATPHLHL
jgi:hypothetical protein